MTYERLSLFCLFYEGDVVESCSARIIDLFVADRNFTGFDLLEQSVVFINTPVLERPSINRETYSVISSSEYESALLEAVVLEVAK